MKSIPLNRSHAIKYFVFGLLSLQKFFRGSEVDLGTIKKQNSHFELEFTYTSLHM